MENKLIGGVMVAVVAIILTGTLLVPIINDSIDGDQDTFTNGTSYAEYYEDDCVLTVTATGVALDSDDLSTSSQGGMYAYGDAFLIYYASASSTTLMFDGSAIITVSDDAEYTITISGDSAVLNDGDSDIATATTSGFYIASSTATDKVFRGAGSGIYFNDLSELFVVYIPSAYSTFILQDGEFTKSGTAYDSTVTGYAAVSGYEDLYLTSSALTITYNTSSTVTMSVPCICNANVTGQVEGTEADSATSSLMLVIPVLVLISVVLGFVGFAYVRKD